MTDCLSGHWNTSLEKHKVNAFFLFSFKNLIPSQIKLDHPFNITEQVLPICLPKTENFLLKESTKCVTTGFGMDKSDIRLQQQISQVRPHRDCEGNYKRASSTQRICLSMGCTCMEVRISLSRYPILETNLVFTVSKISEIPYLRQVIVELTIKF